MRVLRLAAASTVTSPPLPPSPPSGPPNSMNFSRRNPTQPAPPSPLRIWILAWSRNFMVVGTAGESKGEWRAIPPEMRPTVLAGGRDRLALRRHHRHEGAPAGGAAEAHLTAGRGEDRVVLADADVVARVDLRAARSEEHTSELP